MMRPLCRVAELPDGGSKGFDEVFAIRRGDRVWVYANTCPHLGVALDLVPDRFLSRDGTYIVCAVHGAEFRVEDGACLRGPCWGDSLEMVETRVEDGVLLVPERFARPPGQPANQSPGV